jgi:hypothetical protein
MGDATFWLAFKGIPRSAVLDRLSLQGATEPNPEIFGAELPEDWYLVLGNGLNFMDDGIMNRACADGRGVSCYLESHVMISAAAGWENGRRVWSVLHESEKDIDHLETEGELPEPFAVIREAQFAKQKEQGDRPTIDYIFDVPRNLAAAVTGFHYEGGTLTGYPDLEPLELAVVSSMQTERRLQSPRTESWFSKYFE